METDFNKCWLSDKLVSVAVDIRHQWSFRNEKSFTRSICNWSLFITSLNFIATLAVLQSKHLLISCQDVSTRPHRLFPISTRLRLLCLSMLSADYDFLCRVIRQFVTSERLQPRHNCSPRKLQAMLLYFRRDTTEERMSECACSYKVICVYKIMLHYSTQLQVL